MIRSKFLIVSIVCVLLSISTNAQEPSKEIYKISDSIKYPYHFKYEGNPLVTHISATDPDVNVWDDEVWMYCSQDHQKGNAKGNYDVMDGIHAFSSKDLINWTDHGEMLHSRDVSWGKDGFIWAPGAARKNGKYYLYFPHRDKADQWVVGVAISDSPSGPFKDTGKPIAGLTRIDPKIFIDDDGEAYLYNNRAIVAKLKPNMIELAEEVKNIVYAPEEIMKNDTLKFAEGSFMHKRNGIYYYSYTNWHNNTMQGYYGIGKSPYGPFEWKGAFVPQPFMAQNHHSIIEFKGQWYIFYHIQTTPEVKKANNWVGARRLASFDKLYYNEDGTMKIVEHTFKK